MAPTCLGQQPHHQEWGDFMGTPCHAALHDSLRAEQKGLCCYCESGVADPEGHIEHMEPRNSKPARTYDYANLALSCDG
ncbi:TIGR02646 family protein, partial [bacterium]|nr:TIGR02646 family protein [bacterium]